MADSMPNPGEAKRGLKGEFVCDNECCVPNKHYRWKVGNAFATALSGFVAGCAAATIILYPWMRLLLDFCPPPR